MAESAVTSSLRGKFLTCAICLGEYEDPRLLPCFHTFCKECIADLIASSNAARLGHQRGILKCPVCRSRMDVTEADVDMEWDKYFPKNFLLDSLGDEINRAPFSSAELQDHNCDCTSPAVLQDSDTKDEREPRNKKKIKAFKLNKRSESVERSSSFERGDSSSEKNTSMELVKASKPSGKLKMPLRRRGSLQTKEDAEKIQELESRLAAALESSSSKHDLEDEEANPSVLCEKHQRPSKCYCIDCHAGLCRTCATSHLQQNHKVQSLKQKVSESRESLENILGKVPFQQHLVQQNESVLKATERQLGQKAANIKQIIERRRREMKNLVDQIAEETRMEAQSISAAEINRLHVNMERNMSHKAALNSLQDLTQQLLRDTRPNAVIQVMEQERELSLQFNVLTVFLPLSNEKLRHMNLMHSNSRIREKYIRKAFGTLAVERKAPSSASPASGETSRHSLPGIIGASVEPRSGSVRR